MNRKTVISLLAAGMTFISISSALADASTSLGDCYNHVISACNQTAHPIPCSNSGMDACDEEHSASINTGAINKFKIAPKTRALQLTARQ